MAASTDPADVNAGCVVARMTPRTATTQIMSPNFSDYDNDGDGGSRGDTDNDGDRSQFTVRTPPALREQ